MYLQYFGLSEAPFSITPDPRFVYLSPRHEDALAHLQYGIDQQGSGGFIQLTGEVGTGKTTLCRTLLEQLPDNARVALILNPALGPVELLEAICQEFQINLRGSRGSLKRLVDRLNRFLLRTHGEGDTAVLLIDEAQNLSPESLEQVRLLTNLETETKKLLQIILLGQPELRDMLARPDLRQLAQRVTARFHLTPLNQQETGIYVDHRMTVAGNPESPFNKAAHRALHQQSDGIPRLINIIAERALLAAYADNQHNIGAKLVNHAAAEVRGEELGAANVGLWRWAIPLVVVAGVAWASYQWWSGDPTANSAVTPALTETSSEQPAAEEAGSESTPFQPAIAEEPQTRALPVTQFEPAWAALLRNRGISDVPASPDCERRLGPGVYCVSDRASWTQVAELQRPVLLSLPALSGYLVATAVDEKIAVIGGDTAPAVHTEQDITRYWNGQYWDVFAVPGYVVAPMREGQRGPGILWIKSQVQQRGYLGDIDDPYFGPALTTWVTGFQTDTGLPVDGVIGQRTLQLLTQARLVAGSAAQLESNNNTLNGLSDVDDS